MKREECGSRLELEKNNLKSEDCTPALELILEKQRIF